MNMWNMNHGQGIKRDADAIKPASLSLYATRVDLSLNNPAASLIEDVVIYCIILEQLNDFLYNLKFYMKPLSWLSYVAVCIRNVNVQSYIIKEGMYSLLNIMRTNIITLICFYNFHISE